MRKLYGVSFKEEIQLVIYDQMSSALLLIKALELKVQDGICFPIKL